MIMGVIYLYCPYHKINGSVYYAFEYFVFLLKTNKDCVFYVIDLDEDGLTLFIKMFKDKYNVSEEIYQKIVPINRTSLFRKKLERTLCVDVRTLETLRYFLTGEVHCFSNEKHSNIKKSKNYKITYYGSYPDYQTYDIFNYLKLNFEIFKPITNHKTNKVFISSRINPDEIDYSIFNTDKEIYKKTTDGIIENLFDEIDEIIYYHTKLDTNNRIIPEAFFYNKQITIVESPATKNIIDSTVLRYNDLFDGNLNNYYLDNNDEMIKGILC